MRNGVEDPGRAVEPDRSLRILRRELKERLVVLGPSIWRHGVDDALSHSVVFYLVNLEPNLKKLAISQTEMHATSEELETGW